jgi:GNAT superfamily N-acetyltransferase
MPIEIARVRPDALEPFFRANEREALRTFYNFSVVWHEERYQLAARDGETIAGGVQIRVAASLAQVETIVVLPEFRLRGIGRDLLSQAADLANYYNCHKMIVAVPHASPAQRFFERCDYHQEAVLPQHTFKLDIALLRKFLL